MLAFKMLNYWLNFCFIKLNFNLYAFLLSVFIYLLGEGAFSSGLFYPARVSSHLSYLAASDLHAEI